MSLSVQQVRDDGGGLGWLGVVVDHEHPRGRRMPRHTDAARFRC
jgi:hypothetical protein